MNDFILYFDCALLGFSAVMMVMAAYYQVKTIRAHKRLGFLMAEYERLVRELREWRP